MREKKFLAGRVMGCPLGNPGLCEGPCICSEKMNRNRNSEREVGHE